MPGLEKNAGISRPWRCSGSSPRTWSPPTPRCGTDGTAGSQRQPGCSAMVHWEKIAKLTLAARRYYAEPCCRSGRQPRWPLRGWGVPECVRSPSAPWTTCRAQRWA